MLIVVLRGVIRAGRSEDVREQLLRFTLAAHMGTYQCRQFRFRVGERDAQRIENCLALGTMPLKFTREWRLIDTRSRRNERT